MKKLSRIMLVTTITFCANINGSQLPSNNLHNQACKKDSVERQIAKFDKSTENIIKALHLVALKDCTNIDQQTQIVAIAQSVFTQALEKTNKLQK